MQSQQQALSGRDQQIAHLIAEQQSQQQALSGRDQQIAHLIAEQQSQQQALSGRDQQIVHLIAERNRFIQDATHLQSTVRSQEESLTQKQEELTQLVAERERFGQEASQVQETLRTREEYISAIENSVAWMLLVKYRRLRDKIWPDGTRRRQIYDSLKNSCKKLAWGRPPAPQPNDVDPVLPAKSEQSVSLWDKSQRLVPQTSPAKLISQRPDKLILAKLSVVIPTKNGMAEGFESTLRAISRQIGIAETEFIVVDSGSSDGTVEAAKNYGAKVFSIRPEEFNHGATRNYAAEQTTGDLLMFTVQDAIPATQDLFYEMGQSLTC